MNLKEKKIKDVAFELIPKKLRINILNLISDICVNKRDFSNYKFREEIKEYLYIIEKFTLELNDIFSLSMDKREKFLDKINETKKDIKEIARSLFIYDNFKLILFDLFNDESNYRKINEYNDFQNYKFDYYAVLGDCFKFIYEKEGETEFRQKYIESVKKGKIISCLPMKMTKARYNDYLRNSFLNMFRGTTKNSVIGLTEFLKYAFAPFNIKGYGKSFHHIGDKLLSLFDIDIPSLSDTDIEENIELIFDLEVDIDELKEILSSFYNDLNYIQNLALFCVDSEYLFEDDIMFKDLYFSTKNIIEAGENEIFIDDILDRVYDKIELMENEIDSMDKNFDDILDMIDIEKISEDVYTYVMTKIRIDDNFNEELHLSMMNCFDRDENDVLADEQFLNDKIDDFLDFVKNSCLSIPNPKAKKIKAIFLRNIMCPMDSKEYKEYIEYVIKSLEDMERETEYMCKLSDLFEREGFNIDNYNGENNMEHKHHEHCDCGHTHCHC